MNDRGDSLHRFHRLHVTTQPLTPHTRKRVPALPEFPHAQRAPGSAGEGETEHEAVPSSYDFTDYVRGGRRRALARERLELICLCCEVAFLRDTEQINWGGRAVSVGHCNWGISRK